MLRFFKKIKKNTCRFHYQNPNDVIYNSWDIEQNILKLVILGHFCPFTPLKHPKSKILKKLKKIPDDIIILQMCAINDSHMMYGSWDTECNGQNFLSIWTIFCSFTPLPNSPKKQNFGKMKKTSGDIIILHRYNINGNHMMYGSWDVEHDEQNFLSFWSFFCPFMPLTAQKIKFFKKWKKNLEISSFYNSVPKNMIICYTVPEIWCVTDEIIFH